MKYLLSICIIFSIFFTVNAQQNSYFKEFLKEKIPSQEVRENLRAIKNKKDKKEDYSTELNALKTLISNSKTVNNHDKLLSDNNFEDGAEPFIIINPNNPDNVVVSFIVIENLSLSIPIYVTMDGGLTWSQSDFDTDAILSDNLGAVSLGGGDPTLVFDHNGRLHITWLLAYLNGSNINMAMFYAYSDDGGQTIVVPPLPQHMLYEANLLNNQFLDRQWMATDFSGGEYQDNLYISALYIGTDFDGSGEIVIIKDINNIEEDYSVSLVLPSEGTNSTQFGNVEVDDQGNVHVSCVTVNESTQSGNIYYNKSTDGGQTFTNTQLAELTSTFPNGDNVPKIVHSRENTATSLAVDGNNVYIAWSDMSNQTIKSYYLFSNDSGANWSDPIEFGPELIEGENYHLMPNVSADSDRMSIAWYAVDSNSLIANFWYAESQDGGQSLINAQIISDAPTDFTGENTSANFFGDYNTSDSNGCLTYTVWSDGSTGTPNVYVATMDGCAVGIAETTPINGSFSLGKIYPNPIATNLNIHLNSSFDDVVSIVIFSIEGKSLINHDKVNVNQGDNEVTIEGIDLKSGDYILKITNQNHQYITRTIVVK